jgi:xanthine dehydrogenase/oxidase
MRITFLNNNPNPLGVLGSKCVGEPPLCLSASVLFAVKKAVEAARLEIQQDVYFDFAVPATPENVHLSSKVSYEQFKFHD